MHTRVADQKLNHHPPRQGQDRVRRITLVVGLLIAALTLMIVMNYGNIGI